MKCIGKQLDDKKDKNKLKKTLGGHSMASKCSSFLM
jgi:hypothetical protein